MKRARRILPWLALAALSAACGFGSDDETDQDVPETALRSGRGHLDCNAHAFYCEALDRFETGAPLPNRPAPYAIVGRAISARGEGGIWEVSEEVDWFVAHRELMAFGEVTDETDEERQQIREILDLLRAGQPAPPDHPVSVFVRGLASSDDRLRYAPVHGRSSHDHNPLENVDRYFRRNGREIIAVELQREAFIVGVFVMP